MSNADKVEYALRLKDKISEMLKEIESLEIIADLDVIGYKVEKVESCDISFGEIPDDIDWSTMV